MTPATHVRLACCVFAIAAATLAAAAAATDTQPPATPATTTAPTTSPAIIISYETTRITWPLLASGMPDYVAALHKQYSQGVVRENNAAVLILQVLDPKEVLAANVRKDILRALEIPSRFAPPRYLSAWPNDQESALRAAMRGPWQADTLPEVSKWLQDNKEPLDLLVEASKRPRYFIPIVPRNEWLVAQGTPLSVRRLHMAVDALIMRANSRAGEGDIANAWQDILAAYRFSNLLGQGPTLIDRLMALRIARNADNAAATLAASGRLSAAQAQSMLHDLATVGSPPSTASAIDTYERYSLLQMFALGGARRLEDFLGSNLDRIQAKLFLGQLDPNDKLRLVNVFFDQARDAAAKTTLGARWAATAEIDKKIGNKTFFSSDDPSRRSPKLCWWGNHELPVLLLTVTRPQKLADIALVRRDVTMVSLALVAYRDEHGFYPERLDDLSPEFLQHVPRDRVSDKPLIYRTNERDYILYSIGQDMVDNGGQGETSSKGDVAVKTPGWNEPSTQPDQP